MSMLILFESRYTLKGRYTIGNVGKTASMSMLTLFEGRYNFGNVGKTASMSMLTLFESRYTCTCTLNNQPVKIYEKNNAFRLIVFVLMWNEGKYAGFRSCFF